MRARRSRDEIEWPNGDVLTRREAMADAWVDSLHEVDPDIWMDEDGDLYAREGQDFVPIDPHEMLYGDEDFRRDVGL